MKVSSALAILPALLSLTLPGCQRLRGQEEQPPSEHQSIVVTSPKSKDVILTEPYVCQIRSRRHIDVRALQDGYLDKILVNEGQPVKKNQVMFTILPTLYEAKYNAELAEVQLAQIELDNTKKLLEKNYVSLQDKLLHEAKLNRAKAKATLAKAERDFCEIKAPFDGIVDRLHEREGSLIKERDVLTTLSDNNVMWVYFNVREARYLEYMAMRGQDKEKTRIELKLADGSKFPNTGEIGAIEANFNNQTGNIAFRADFDNIPVKKGQPDLLLRHGQTGTVLIHRTLHNAIVIPQRAVFEILDKRYVYVVGKDEVVRQREIVVQHALDDIFLIDKGLAVTDRIVLEGVRQVRDGAQVEYEVRSPEETLANQKHHAE
jgi:membrane fusion protein (multidrug efflux system)